MEPCLCNKPSFGGPVSLIYIDIDQKSIKIRSFVLLPRPTFKHQLSPGHVSPSPSVQNTPPPLHTAPSVQDTPPPLHIAQPVSVPLHKGLNTDHTYRLSMHTLLIHTL